MRPWRETKLLASPGSPNDVPLPKIEEGAELSMLERSYAVRPCNFFVALENNVARQAWEILLMLALVYTGTIFLYRLAFLEFNISDVISTEIGPWHVVARIVDALFWVDLAINFLFTYRDIHGKEIQDLPAIGKHYLKTFFLINLISCLPAGAFTPVLRALNASRREEGNPMNKLSRLVRLQRMSRLVRLTKLVRLVKIGGFMIDRSETLQWLKSFRGVRVLNFVVGLVWVVHVVACGWYLCAALHHKPEETWVGRRIVSMDGRSLIDTGPLEQWSHAMYLVLTVFTTIGFGDMHAVTVGEIVYLCCAMILGAIVNSIIVSSMISAVTAVDDRNAYIIKQKELVNAFGHHTQLDRSTQRQLELAIEMSCENAYEFDRDDVKKVLTSHMIPREVLSVLPAKLFGGALVKNRFVSICAARCVAGKLPTRFPVVLALALTPCHFMTEEIVYQMNDYALNMFLVLSGVFSHVGFRTAEFGLIDGAPRGNGQLALDNRMNAITSILVKTAKSRASPIAKEAARGLEDSINESECSLHAYKLFCRETYFGDVELLRKDMRHASVRCEIAGTTLVLGKVDLHRFIDEYPQFGMTWRACALSRERLRHRLLERGIAATSSRVLAARFIQAFHRSVIDERNTPSALSMRRMCTLSMRVVAGMEGMAKVTEYKYDSEEAILAKGGKDLGSLLEEVQEMRSHMTSQIKGLHAGMAGMASEVKALRGELSNVVALLVSHSAGLTTM